MQTHFVKSILIVLVTVGAIFFSPEFVLAAPLPEGNNGIAARYPGDVGIASDPAVVFFDDFESYSSPNQLTSRWSNYYQGSYTGISTAGADVFSGSKSLQFQLPVTGGEVSNAVVKNINPTQDILFVRAYTKFESGFNTASIGHNGIRISSRYPGPGRVPNGTDFFFLDVENSVNYNEAQPGYTHAYIYHPEQRSQWGDHWYPNGRVLPYDATLGNFGPEFIARPNVIPQTNRWYSYELMLKANTPGQRDGRVAVWIDGTLIADFPNVRVRDVATLKIDQIQLELHSKSNSVRINRKWYDNVVAATSYIGPMASTSAQPLQPPTNLRLQ